MNNSDITEQYLNKVYEDLSRELLINFKLLGKVRNNVP